jgi:hypothetical protein
LINCAILVGSIDFTNSKGPLLLKDAVIFFNIISDFEVPKALSRISLA